MEWVASEHEKSGIYKITCKTCHKSYVGQTSRNISLRFREHVRYIKNNDPRSAYALHTLNCRHEYGNINDTMTLLKQISNPSVLLPHEQMYIQIFRRNNELIREQHPNEHNPMFELL
jgi:phosphoribulokinase